MQERRQKNFQEWKRATEKTRPKNSTIKPLSILSVSCMKIQGGTAPADPRCRRPCLHAKIKPIGFVYSFCVSNVHYYCSIVLFVCFVPSLSCCHEKATVALYFGRIRTRLGVFQVFRLFSCFLPLNLLLVRSHQAEIIIVKRLIQGCNNVYDEGGS